MLESTSILGDLSITDIFNLVVWGVLFLILISKFFTSIRVVPTPSSSGSAITTRRWDPASTP